VSAVLATAALPAAPAGAASAPEWVWQACAEPIPAFAAVAPSLLLLDEEVVAVPERGRIVTVQRRAVRVLSATDRRHEDCIVPYLRGTSEVRDLRAWIVEGNGRVRKFDKTDAVDVSRISETELYSDFRALVLEVPDVPVGAVIAWESRKEEDPLIAEWVRSPESSRPTLLSRFSLELPDGLEPRALVSGADSLPARHEGNTWVWEQRNLSPPRPELLAPSDASHSAQLVVSVRGDGTATPAGTSFSGWAALALWLDDLTGAQASVTPDVASRAASLTATVSEPLARIHALARAVQGLNYIQIDLGIGRGWGWRPRAASDVLRAGYGDCKDKSNLLRALLHAAGFNAWLMLVYSRDRDRVDERRVSPYQFDHCIVAVRVPDDTGLPGVFRQPGLGTLLAFDPTDPFTSLGDLPADEQGSLALLVSRSAGGLVRLPVAPPEENRIERKVEAFLDAAGRLTARLELIGVGQEAAHERGLRHRMGQKGYRSYWEQLLSAAGASVSLSTFEIEDDESSGRYLVKAEYEAPLFVRRGQSQSLVLRPALLTPRDLLDLPDSARTMPVALPAACLVETVIVHLPDGFEVEELPDAMDRQTDFATLSASWRLEGGILRFARARTVRPVTLPPNRYREVLDFARAWLGVTQRSVFLKPR
jgi:transglutaminase-like putative cysteine protease